MSLSGTGLRNHIYSEEISSRPDMAPVLCNLIWQIGAQGWIIMQYFSGFCRVNKYPRTLGGQVLPLSYGMNCWKGLLSCCLGCASIAKT